MRKKRKETMVWVLGRMDTVELKVMVILVVLDR